MTDIFFELVGGLTSICFLVISGTLFLVGKREAGMLGMLGALLGVCISGALKMTIAHPRPFWKYSSVLAVQCPKDFGAPSGHAMSAGGGLLVLGLLWLKSGGSYSKKVLLIVFGVLITAIDRVYLGVHFYFQVTLGYTYAALVTAILLHPRTREFVRNFSYDMKAVIKTHIGLLAGLLCGILIYEFRDPEWDSLWTLNYKERCNSILSLKQPMLKSFGEANLVCFIAGLAMGAYFLRDKAIPRFSIQLVLTSMMMHIGLMSTLKSVDATILSNLTGAYMVLALSVHRYVFGLMHTYFLPIFLGMIFGSDKISVTPFSKVYRI